MFDPWSARFIAGGGTARRTEYIAPARAVAWHLVEARAPRALPTARCTSRADARRSASETLEDQRAIVQQPPPGGELAALGHLSRPCARRNIRWLDLTLAERLSQRRVDDPRHERGSRPLSESRGAHSVANPDLAATQPNAARWSTSKIVRRNASRSDPYEQALAKISTSRRWLGLPMA